MNKIVDLDAVLAEGFGRLSLGEERALPVLGPSANVAPAGSAPGSGRDPVSVRAGRRTRAPGRCRLPGPGRVWLRREARPRRGTMRHLINQMGVGDGAPYPHAPCAWPVQAAIVPPRPWPNPPWPPGPTGQDLGIVCEVVIDGRTQ